MTLAPRNPDWRLRRAGADDAEAIIACRRACFPTEDLDKRELAFWRWEFAENPAGAALCFVAEVGDRIVGHYAVIPQRFWLGDATRRGAIVVDVMTRPDYRRQGLFEALGRFALEECESEGSIEFATAYPVRPQVFAGFLNQGWKIDFRIGTWIMPLRAGDVAAALLPGLRTRPRARGALGLLPGLVTRGWSGWSTRVGGRGEARSSDSLPQEGIEEFCLRLAADRSPATAMQERSPEWLRWRYRDHPTREYRFHTARGAHGEIVGLGVTRPMDLLGVDALAIADLLLLPDDPSALPTTRSLVASIRRAALEQGRAAVAMMQTTPDAFLPHPGRLGFLPTHHRFSFITRAIGSQPPPHGPGRRWHLMWGDTDDI